MALLAAKIHARILPNMVFPLTHTRSFNLSSLSLSLPPSPPLLSPPLDMTSLLAPWWMVWSSADVLSALWSDRRQSTCAPDTEWKMKGERHVV
jgi:hypothetical protein